MKTTFNLKREILVIVTPGLQVQDLLKWKDIVEKAKTIKVVTPLKKKKKK